MTQTPEIDIEAFAASRHQGVVVDVREPMEYVVAHVPGATLIPMSQFATRMAEIEKDRPVFVICASGHRSLAVTDLLRHSGYDACSVAGGTYAWMRSGRPIEEGLP